MAYNKSGPSPSVGLLTDVDTVKRNPLGYRTNDEFGGEYVYLQGIASTIVGSWVVFPSSTFITTLGVANSKGKVAVAMAAILASQFGWYQIYGLATGSVATGAAGAKVWWTATPGRVDNSDVAVDLIVNAIQVGATGSNLATFDLNYPFAHNEVLN